MRTYNKTLVCGSRLLLIMRKREKCWRLIIIWQESSHRIFYICFNTSKNQHLLYYTINRNKRYPQEDLNSFHGKILLKSKEIIIFFGELIA